MMSKKELIHERMKDRTIYKEKRNRDDVLKVLDIPEGRRYLWKLMSETGAFQVGFSDKETILFNEGKRFIGVKIFNEIMETRPEKFLQMQKEYKADVTIDKRLVEELRTEEQNDFLS